MRPPCLSWCGKPHFGGRWRPARAVWLLRSRTLDGEARPGLRFLPPVRLTFAEPTRPDRRIR